MGGGEAPRISKPSVLDLSRKSADSSRRLLAMGSAVFDARPMFGRPRYEVPKVWLLDRIFVTHNILEGNNVTLTGKLPESNLGQWP